MTTDPAELAVIEAIGKGIIRAGVPKLVARVGEVVETTWGCEGNKRLKSRQATIYRVEVALTRHPQSMFFKPQLFYYGRDERCNGMVLGDFTTKKGLNWVRPKGEKIWVDFALEWLGEDGAVQRLPGRGVHFIRETEGGAL